jgi:L-2-hydroxyglutarate oxidase
VHAASTFRVAVIGGGIVGLAFAHALVRRRRLELVVLEAEGRLGAHQTGHNSGVLHSGLYYRPGSEKARTCVDGVERMFRFCAEHGVRSERCGKLVVATCSAEVARLDELERRGVANGLTGLRRLDAAGVREVEPHVDAPAGGLWVPQTGIVDFREVAAALARRLAEQGVEIRTDARVARVVRTGDALRLVTRAGELTAHNLVNCAGLHSDRVARLCGVEPGLRIVPFRGEYYRLRPARAGLVRHLVYPVPDPRLPFLGVHLTRTIHGTVEAGPNAVLAWSRNGYAAWSFSARDCLEVLAYRGFWRMAARYWKVGVGELFRSWSTARFARDVRRMVPAIGAGDLERDGCGVRAQAVAPDGSLVDDFRVVEGERMLHVLNAPSPAATASLSIGETLAARAERTFDLG